MIIRTANFANLFHTLLLHPHSSYRPCQVSYEVLAKSLMPPHCHSANDPPQFSLYISDSKGSGFSCVNPPAVWHFLRGYFYHKLHKFQHVLDVFICAVYDKIETLSVAGSKGLQAFRFAAQRDSSRLLVRVKGIESVQLRTSNGSLPIIASQLMNASLLSSAYALVYKSFDDHTTTSPSQTATA